MEKTKKLLSDIKVWILAAIGILLALFLNEKRKREKAEVDLENAETAHKSSIIDEKRSQVSSDIKAEEKLRKDLKGDNKKAKEEASKADVKDVEDFYKKRGI